MPRATISADVPTVSRRTRSLSRFRVSRAPLRVAVLGAGTVGREVIRGLLEARERLTAADGSPLVLTGVACRDLDRAKAAGIPGELLTDAPAHLVADPATDVVVELMGGDEPARTLIAAALGAGKPVVTANKHVIAHHGSSLEGIARRTGTALRFEAAVGGGIPVLGPLAADLAANRVRRVRGIVNGTTNFILTAMAEAGRPYDEVLADAQELGYAEADPTGDVAGDDAVNKLVILARLAFGGWLDPMTVGRRPPTVRRLGAPGITGVTDRDLEAAACLGLTIKLLASASSASSAADGAGGAGSGPFAAVLPTAVPAAGALGRTHGVTNLVEVDGDPVGTVGLSGPGAGGAATSSAVLGDLVAIARGLGSTWAGLPPAVDGARPAADPLVSARRWVTFLPGVSPEAVATALPGGALARVADGTAIRTEAAALADVRTALAGLLPDGVDATLYPIDD
jgi:homoserine dehydrogenase